MRSNTGNAQTPSGAPAPPLRGAPPDATPPGDAPPNDIQLALEHVALLRAALIDSTPESLEQTLPGLEQAAQALEQLKTSLHQNRAGGAAIPAPEAPPGGSPLVSPDILPPTAPHDILRRQLETLDQELRRAARLGANAAAFWQGWARLLGLDTGYTPAGVTAPAELDAAGPAPAARRVSVRG